MSQYPLTPKQLEAALIELYDKTDAFVFDYDLMSTIQSLSKGSNITNKLSTTTFDTLFEYVQNMKQIKIAKSGMIHNVMSAICEETSDGFAFVTLTWLNEDMLHKVTFSKLENAIYLDTNTTITLS